MRTYELMFIVRPDITDEDLDKLVSTLETQATNAGATVKNIERMGKRRLAYTVRKFNDGIYILFTLEGPGPVVKEIERRLRVNEPVIKFITVRIDETLKRLEKRKKDRDKRAARRPAPPAPAPAQPAFPQQTAESPAMPGLPKEA